MYKRTKKLIKIRRSVINRILCGLVLMMAIILTIIVTMDCQKEDSTRAQVADITSTAGIAKFLSKQEATMKSRQHLLLKQMEEAETTTENSVEPTTEDQTKREEGETTTSGQPTTYKTIEEVKISKDMYIGKTLGISKEDFIKLIADYDFEYEASRAFFLEHAGYIWDVSQLFQINELAFSSLIAQESGWGIDPDCVEHHNYTGYKPNGCKKVFESDQQCLWESARNLTNYLPGGMFYNEEDPLAGTLIGMAPIYCPDDLEWANDIYSIMEQFLENYN